MKDIRAVVEGIRAKRKSPSARKGMGLAHFMPEELHWLNEAQGEESIDPETGFPEYSKLSPVFKKPAVRKFFLTLKEEVELAGHINPALEKVAGFLSKRGPKFHDTKPKTRLEETYKEAGIGKDTQIALVPFSVLDLFDEIRGETKINTKTGLPMYIFGSLGKVFQTVVRVGAPIVGAMVGGPAGAAAGSALGHLATGNRDPMSILRNAGLSAGAASLASGAGLIGTSSTAAPIFSGSGAAAKAAAASSHTAGAASTAASKVAESGFLDKALSFAKDNPGALLSAAAAAMAIRGNRSKKAELEQRYEDEKKEKEERERRAGRYTPLKSSSPHEDYDRMQSFEKDFSPKIMEYKKGGWVKGKPIVGPGNGQSDSINFDGTPEGSWVFDASTTSDLGDGTTEAGFKEIKKIERFIEKSPTYKSLDYDFKPHQKPRKIKTALSNGEYVLPTRIVTALGHGDNEKGANVLRRMTQNIRIYKNSKGDQLPPPIKDPLRFLQKAVHEELRV